MGNHQRGMLAVGEPSLDSGIEMRQMRRLVLARFLRKGLSPVSVLALAACLLVLVPQPALAADFHAASTVSLSLAAESEWAEYPRPRAVFGLHDTPILGGSADVRTATNHWQALGVGSVTVLDPRPELLAAARRAGIMVVARAYSSSIFDQGDLRGVTKAMVDNGFRYVIPFNEPNLRVECQGREPNPVDFARRWVEAAAIIHRAGGYPVLTPLAPVGDYPDDRYYAEMLTEILRLRSAEWLLSVHAVVGLHAYEVPGQDYRSILQRYAEATRARVGRYLPLMATEAGVPPATGTSLPAAEASWARSLSIRWELSNRPLPEYVLAVNLWVYSNRAQGGHDQRWEGAAWFAQPGVHSFLHVVRDDKTVGYVVEPGDSLASIARRFGTTAEKLAIANNLKTPAEVLIGDTIVVPGEAPRLKSTAR